MNGASAAIDGMRSPFSKEALIAFLIALLVIALIIMTADEAPQWIYQGF